MGINSRSLLYFQSCSLWVTSELRNIFWQKWALDGGGNEVGFGPLDWRMDGACCDFSPNCTTASELRLWEGTRLFPAWCPLSRLKSHGRVQFQEGRCSAILVSVTAFWQPLASQDQLGYSTLCFPWHCKQVEMIDERGAGRSCELLH